MRWSVCKLTNFNWIKTYFFKSVSQPLLKGELCLLAQTQYYKDVPMNIGITKDIHTHYPPPFYKRQLNKWKVKFCQSWKNTFKSRSEGCCIVRKKKKNFMGAKSVYGRPGSHIWLIKLFVQFLLSEKFPSKFPYSICKISPNIFISE